MERLDAEIGSVQTAFQEAPEILHGIGVDVPVHIFHGVIDDGMLVVSRPTAFFPAAYSS